MTPEQAVVCFAGAFLGSLAGAFLAMLAYDWLTAPRMEPKRDEPSGRDPSDWWKGE